MAWKLILELSALILSIINGLMLLRSYLRDRPKLSVKPIHPGTYQWFFILPNGKCQGQVTRKYGFLTYISISNQGIREVSLSSWHLYVKTIGGKLIELIPMSIPEPQIELGQSGNLKVWPVLGQKGLVNQGNTMVHAGSCVSGFAYYIAELYGGDDWNLLIKSGKTIGKIVVQSIFGNKARVNIVFTEIPLEKAKNMIEGIDKIDLS
jgi:hypothetical protein